jgi:hypothetical protein
MRALLESADSAAPDPGEPGADASLDKADAAPADAAPKCAGVDIRSSSDHCGSCGHSCLGGACAAGLCKPVTMARDRFRVSDLGKLGTYVYIVEQGSGSADGRLSRILGAACTTPANCLAPEPLLEGLQSPSGLALSPTDAFVTRGTSVGQVVRFALNGATGNRVFASDETFPTRAVYVPVFGSERLIWLQSGAAGALRAKETTSAMPSLVIAGARANPADIALRETTICWSESGDSNLTQDGRVYCSDITGQNIKTIATTQSSPRGLAIDGTFVYWANRGNGTLNRRRLDLSARTEELQSGLDNPVSVAVAADRIVWLESGAEPDYKNGRLRTSDKFGKALRTLAEGETWPTRMIVDETAAYYLLRGTVSKDYKDGEVRRIAF